MTLSQLRRNAASSATASMLSSTLGLRRKVAVNKNFRQSFLDMAERTVNTGMGILRKVILISV